MLKENIRFSPKTHIEIQLVDITEYPIHYHDCLEIIFVMEGSVIIKDGYYVSTIKKGDLWYVGCGDLHSITKTNDSNILLIMHVDLNHFESIFPGIKSAFFASITKNSNESIESAFEKAKEQIIDIGINLLKNKLDRVENTTIHLIQNLVSNFQYFELNGNKFVNEINHKNNYIMTERISRIVGYIYDNYDRKLTLGEISQKEHLNVYYLSHIIKEATKISFQELLNLIRVKNSERMLLGTNKKISEIALDCGFSAKRYYINCFKKWYYTDPDTYRRIHLPKAGLESNKKKMLSFNNEESHKIFLKCLQEQGIKVEYNKNIKDELICIDLKNKGEKYVNPLKNDVKISNDAFLTSEGVQNIIQNMKRDFSLIKTGIDIECLTIGQDSATFVTVARSINYLIQAEIKPSFIIKKPSNSVLSLIDKFIRFYANRFRSNVSQIGFKILEIDKRFVAKNEDWQRKITKRVKKVTSETPDIEIIKIFSEPVEFANCLYDSYLLASFAVDEMLNPKNWDVELDCVAMDPVKHDGNIFEGGSGIFTWNGIPKPWYYAYLMLSKINGNIFEQGEDYLVVGNETQLFILSYNLGGYVPTVLRNIRNHKELSDIIESTHMDRTHKFNIRNLMGEYRITRQTINKDTCLFLRWKDLGFSEYLTEEEEKIISRSCWTNATIKKITIEGDYELISRKEVFEVESIVIEKLL